MNSNRHKPPAPWPIMVIFLIIASSALTFGILYYNYQKKNLLTEKLQELSAISDLKIRQINQWRLERLGDGEYLGKNALIAEKFAELLQKPSDKSIISDLLQNLKSLTENFDYKSIILIDTSRVVRLSYPVEDSYIGDYLRPLIPGIIKNRKVILTDLHRASLVSYIHLDLIIPLINHNMGDTVVTGLMALRIDPHKVLYPLVQSWPTPSKSAETLLIKRAGDEIVYMNELRHVKNQELLFRKPATTEKLAAVLAVQGIDKSVDAMDYRGVPVVATMKKIPATAWYMVTKIDRDEVLSDLGSQMTMVSIILFLIVLASGLALGFFIRNQRVRYYREKYEAELDRLALVRHFDYILKFANDIILLIDSDLKIVEANDRALETYQYTRNEFIGLKVDEIRAPEALPQLNEHIKYIDENESGTFETVHKRKDGTVFPVEISSRLVNIEGSSYYQTIGRDITERRLAEDTLRENEEKFRKIFEESPFCMVMTAKDYLITRANLSFCKMIGYSEDELKMFTFKNFTHPDYISADELSMLRLVSGEIPVYQTEKRYIRKNGVVIWGSTTISILRNNKGEVQFFLGMIEDITARKVAEDALEKSYSLVKATLESTEDGLLVVDSNGRIVQFNQKFTEMWRIPQEIIDTGEDRLALDFVKNQLINPDSFLENVKKLYAEPETTTFDLLEFNDGRIFERYSQSQKINGKGVGRVWSFRDITEKKKAEKDLIAAKEKAEESDRLKTAFLHNVSHEIRTPMNAIVGFSTLLNEPDLHDPERKQYIEIISQSSNQLLSIINDIVDIANVESGQVKMNFREMNLNSTMRNLNEQFSFNGNVNGNSIPINLTLGLTDNESVIVTDVTKVVQILSNLLSNSLKFTSKGYIEFGYNLKGGFLEFFVMDTGIGIPKDHIGKIFNRFYQVDGEVSRKYGGTGLGLSICKAYVELLGGSISVDSDPGRGTVFIFTIPYLTA